MKFSNLKYLIIDVDGTLTDGGIYYDETGNELKKFNTKDAAGIFVAKKLGIKTVVITGRECNATKRRLEELNVDFIYQKVRDKVAFVNKLMKEKNIKKEEIGYIGDDLNDYESMLLTGFIACPNDACKEIKEIANYVSNINGGYGAVREIIESMLEKEKLWKKTANKVYNIGI